ncbi:MAG: GIY-YIG nuclease family protein [Lachnospiraceae bacterium]|nr:GIY-YIG nuclease family protein [Lachnospiraceae bacterium]
MKNYTYIVECSDGSLYTGWTNDIKKRIKTHNQGKGAKYTRTRLPVRLVYTEEFPTKQEAMQREYQIKHLSRKEKLHLVQIYSRGKNT